MARRQSFQQGWVERLKGDKFRIRWREWDKLAGKWREKSRTLKDCRSEKQARVELSKVLPGVNDTNNHPDRKPQVTFGEFAGGRWRSYLANEKVELSTISSYQSMLDKHILPRFKDVKLTAITPDNLTVFFDALRDLVSTKYALNIYGLLHVMFEVAAEYELIETIPLKRKLHRPGHEATEKAALSAEQVRVALQFIIGEYRLLVLLLAVTGLRIGELLGLRRFNFNPDLAELTLTHTLWRARLKDRAKTAASKATFQLPEGIAGLLNRYLAESRFQESTDFIFHKETAARLILTRFGARFFTRRSTPPASNECPGSTAGTCSDTQPAASFMH